MFPLQQIYGYPLIFDPNQYRQAIVAAIRRNIEEMPKHPPIQAPVEVTGKQSQMNSQVKQSKLGNVKSSIAQKKSATLPIILKGQLFGDLKPIPTNPAIDPPANVCHNCWQPGHTRFKCTRPTGGAFCKNCGRRTVTIETCPRCGEKHREYQKKLLEVEKKINNQIFKSNKTNAANRNFQYKDLLPASAKSLPVKRNRWGQPIKDSSKISGFNSMSSKNAIANRETVGIHTSSPLVKQVDWMSSDWTSSQIQSKYQGQNSSSMQHFYNHDNKKLPSVNHTNSNYIYKQEFSSTDLQKTSNPVKNNYDVYQQQSTLSGPSKIKNGKYSDVWSRIDGDPQNRNDSVEKRAKYGKVEELKDDLDARKEYTLNQVNRYDDQEVAYSGDSRSNRYVERDEYARDYRDKGSERYDEHSGKDVYQKDSRYNDDRESRYKDYEREDYKTAKPSYGSSDKYYKEHYSKSQSSRSSEPERYRDNYDKKYDSYYEDRLRDERSRLEKGGKINVDRLNDALKLAESLKGLPADTQNAVWKAVFTDN